MYCKVVSFIIFLCLSSEILSQRSLRLWYNSPASDWESSVPLGNGHLGAMPDGGVLNENIVLNDITLWSGGIQDADKPDAYKTLPEIRRLLFEGKNIETQQLMSRSFVCKGKGSGEGNGAKILADGSNKPYTQLKSDHTKKYRQLFDRSTLSLTGETKDNVPTDERLAAFAKDAKDNYLPVLYFQYGRYLLISSTRPNLLPPNLQGLWANTIKTPWNGDYHLNINIQMNHWPLDVTNLGTLNESFFTLVKGLVKPGEETAKAYYNANGWVAHVITNVWGYTSPGEDYSWGSYNTGSAWLCQMLWNHYEFTRDTAYLRALYPILKGSSEFYLSMLAKEPSLGKDNYKITS